MNILKKTCMLVLILVLGISSAWADGRTKYFNTTDTTSYQGNMYCTAIVKLNGKVLTNCELAAFDSNNRLRGSVISQDQTGEDGRCYLTIQGEGRTEPLHFCVVYGPDDKSRIIANVPETFTFCMDSQVGSYEHPFEFNVITIGDVNLDKKLDITDVTALISILNGTWDSSTEHGDTDINGDGKTDVNDVQALRDEILGK